MSDPYLFLFVFRLVNLTWPLPENSMTVAMPMEKFMTVAMCMQKKKTEASTSVRYSPA